MTQSKEFMHFEKMGSFYKGDLTTNETVTEFIDFHQHTYWCPDLLSTIELDISTGVYKTYPSDEYVFQLFRVFVDMRLSVAREFYSRAQDVAEKKVIQRAEKWFDYARKSLSWSNINAAVNLWKKIKCISSTDLDQHLNLLGTPVGILDIDRDLLTTLEYEMDERNFKLSQSETMSTGEGLFITKSTKGAITNTLDDVRLQQDLTPDTRWQQFIDEISCGDCDLASYLQRALGYSAFCGGNPEECMFLAHGASTRNGKSTLLNSIAYAMGDYAKSASNDFLLKKKFNSQADKDELALLQGVRLLVISEPPAGEEIDESKTKSLTGNDVITTSKKYGHTFSYQPQFTMWCMTNSLPCITDVSLVESGRVQVIPFERHFTPDEHDPTLKSRFKTAQGVYTILNWLWQGYKSYKTHGLMPPECVQAATTELVGLSGKEFDIFVMNCLQNKVNSRVSLNDFKRLYFDWCEATGAEPMSMRQVNQELRTRGFGRQRSNGQDWYTSMCVVGGFYE